MSDTYAKVTGEGVLRWQFEKSLLILEYKDTKPPLPPPFNVPWYISSAVLYAWRKLQDVSLGRDAGSAAPSDGFKNVPPSRDLRLYQRQERTALATCLAQQRDLIDGAIDSKVDKLVERIEKLEAADRSHFEDLKGLVKDMSGSGTRAKRRSMLAGAAAD